METLPYVLAAVGVSCVAILASTRFISIHHEARSKVIFSILVGSIIWLLMSALSVSSDSLPTKLIFFQLQFVGIVIVPTTWLILAMQLSGYERWVKRNNLALLGVPPAVTLLLVFTNEFHHFIWANLTLNVINPFFPLNETRAIGYWMLIIGYSEAIIIVALTMFVRRVLASRSLYRRQAMPVIFACCIPWALTLVWFLNPSISMYIDLDPLALTVATSILMGRLAYLPRADVVPVAHEIIVDSMNDGVILLDAQSRIVDLNPKAEQLVGSSVMDAMGRRVEELWPEWAQVEKELDSGPETMREVMLGVEEKKRAYELQISYMSGTLSDRSNLLLIFRDISERKEMEQRLLRAEHLAAIGETASMVAHDLRNPLQGIITAAHILKDERLTGDEKKEMIQLIEGSVAYAEATVRDLLDYSRELHLVCVEASPRDLVQSALQAVRVPEKVKVQDFSQKEPAVYVDPDRMKRVFINLAENAFDAMPAGGTLTIKTEESDGYLRFSVSDTGSGMPEEIMENLWKPLHTTKAKGMGLGLPIVKRIITAHRGDVSVETRLGKGTTFTIRLPIERETVQTPPAVRNP